MLGPVVVTVPLTGCSGPPLSEYSAVQVTTTAGDLGVGVRTAAINRELDLYVQRQLRVGYNRAARLIEQMEQAGLVSPAEHNGNRTVLVPAREE